MIRVESAAEMKARGEAWRAAGRTIGLVPTMGALHDGHLSLVRESRRRADVTVVSVFVNPAQFGPGEDYERYPRDPERDAALLAAEGADALFLPPAAEIYPPGYRTWVEVEGLQDRLCGGRRPGHFRGVCTVVLRLFRIIRPDLAVFGWKDAQQFLILDRMVRDLELGVAMVPAPIVREPDGLAMSSRNAYLSPEERRAARVVPASLDAAREMLAAGERDPGRIVGRVRALIEAEPLARVDYVEAVDPRDLEPLARIEAGALLAAAVFIGRTRLIDNVRFSTDE